MGPPNNSINCTEHLSRRQQAKDSSRWPKFMAKLALVCHEVTPAFVVQSLQSAVESQWSYAGEQVISDNIRMPFGFPENIRRLVTWLIWLMIHYNYF